jgi:hypothetical protein
MKRNHLFELKKLFLIVCLLTTIMSCDSDKSEIDEDNSVPMEMEDIEEPQFEDTENDDINVSDCKNKFDYENDKLVYVYCCPCEHWENKLDEYLKRNNSEVSNDQKLQNISSDMSLEAYVEKIYGFSTLEEAKQAYVKAGGNGEGLFRFSKSKFNK